MLLDEGIWFKSKKEQNEKAEAIASASHFLGVPNNFEPCIKVQNYFPITIQVAAFSLRQILLA
jgi:hypothetical protein